MKYPVYAVIMAGGMGERFWPRSRMKKPKQLLPLLSNRTMLQETVLRIKPLIQEERILIITNKIQAGLVKRQVPNIPKRNVISEPASRNTAPCIALASAIIKKRQKNADAVMIVLPADHLIENTSKFRRDIRNAVKTANTHKVLVTLGIKPKGPNTGYGYIKIGLPVRQAGKGKFYWAAGFKEKPDFGTAKRYIKTGRYLWNSGIFVWTVDTVLEEIKRYVPEVVKNLKNYAKLPNISIDYGIMERTKKAVTMKVDFIWDDVGNWSALDMHLKKDKFGNVSRGDSVLKDTSGSIIISDSHIVAALGLKNMIVVSSGNAVLVCPKDKAQDVKKIVGLIKKRHKKCL